MTRLFILSPVLVGLFLFSCSIQKLAVRQSVGIIENGFPAFYEEDDLILAETALASNIKLMESLLETTPREKKLLLYTAQAISSYAFGFVEPEMEAFRFSDSDRSRLAKLRARSLYWRGKVYAERALEQAHPKFNASLSAPLDEFDAALKKVSPKYVPYLFWLGFSWGGYINLNKESMSAVSDIVKVEKMMAFVAKYDETYFNGGAHLFLAVYFGSRPKMFGGDPVVAKEHFDQLDRLNQNRNLLSKVMQAQTLAVQDMDRERFDQLLGEVMKAESDIYPEQTLMNQIAKRRAEILQANAKELF